MSFGSLKLSLGLSVAVAAMGGGGSSPPSYVATGDEVFYVLGQSNAITSGVSGAPNLPAGWADTARVQLWNSGTGAFATYSPSTQAGGWGPEVNDALDWLTLNSGNSFVLYIIKHAVSGTQLGSITTYGLSSGAPSDWSITDNDHGSNYLLALAKAQNAQTWLTSHGKTPTCPAILWFQGEADSQLAPALADYTTNALNIYALFRQFPYASASTYIMAHMVSALFTSYNLETMTANQQAVCAAAPTKNFLFDTRGLAYQGDTLHMQPASVNIAGDAIFQMSHGGYVPTALAYTPSPIATDSPDNTSAGYLTCVCRDNSSPAVWSLVGLSNQWVVAPSAIPGVGTIRKKTGATLVQGTYTFNVRVDSASGLAGALGYAILSVTITVGAAGTGVWRESGPFTMDWANDQYSINNVDYLGSAALASATRYSPSTNSIDLTSIMPASFTMLAQGHISPHNVNGSVPNCFYVLDDGADASATDEIFSIHRGNPSGSGMYMVVNKGGVAQVATNLQYVSIYQPLTFVKTAARGTLNDMNMAINGSLPAAGADGGCQVPNLLRFKWLDRETGARPWGGDIWRAGMSLTVMNDAALVAATT